MKKLPACVEEKQGHPLGSNLSVAAIGQTEKAQRCMLNQGFEPKDQMSLVCRAYPQLRRCQG